MAREEPIIFAVIRSTFVSVMIRVRVDVPRHARRPLRSGEGRYEYVYSPAKAAYITTIYNIIKPIV